MIKFSKQDTLITKGIATILLIFHHLFYDDFFVSEVDKLNYNYLLTPISSLLCKYGYVCVFIFSCLSGYAIYKKIESEQDYKKVVIKYETNLLFSFISVYIVCCILWFLNINDGGNGIIEYWNSYGDYSIITKLFMIVIDMLGCADLFGSKTINPSWWYMGAAHLIILILPIFIKFNEKYETKYTIFIILLAFSSFISEKSIDTKYVAIICCVLSSYIGYILSSSNYFQYIYNHKYISTILSIIIFLFSIFISDRFGGYLSFGVFGGIAFMTLTFCIVNKLFFIKRFLAKIGEKSNIIYMSHVFFISKIECISYLIKNVKSAVLAFFITVSICYLFSWLMHKILKSRNILSLKNSIINTILKH